MFATASFHEIHEFKPFMHFMFIPLTPCRQPITSLLFRLPNNNWCRHRWIDNFKMDLIETGLGGVDWIGLAQDRCRWKALVNMVMNLQVP
jgi:hypothetical protein